MRPVPEAIRLVALDLDGTVVAPNLSVSKRIIEVIAEAKTQGVETTLVTGRMYSATKPFSRLLGISAPVICFQGAGIYDPTTDEVLREQPVDPYLVQLVIAFAKDRDLHLQLYAEGTYFVEQLTDFGLLYAQVCGLLPVVVPSLAERFADAPSTKIVFVTQAAYADNLARELRDFCGTEGYVTRSNPEFVEVMAPGVDKGDSLRWVAQRLGVSPHAMMAVGDSWNDIPMLHAAAFGVAMGSAPAELCAVADAMVADVEHDGVVEAYGRFVLRAPAGTIPT